MNPDTITKPQAVIIEQAEPQELVDARMDKVHCIQLWESRGRMDFRLGAKLLPIHDMYKEEPAKAAYLYGQETFNDLLNAPRESDGLDIPYSSAMRAIRMWRKLKELDVLICDRCDGVGEFANEETGELTPCGKCIEGTDVSSIAGLDYTKLDLLLSNLTEDNWIEKIQLAKSLSRGDLKKELSEGDNEPRITTQRKLEQMDAGELRYVLKHILRYVREKKLAEVEAMIKSFVELE